MQEHKEYLKKYKWKNEEAQATPLVVDAFRTTYLETIHAYNRSLYTVCIYSIKEEYCHECVRADEIENTLAWSIEMYTKDKEYFDKKYVLFNEVKQKIEKIFADLVSDGISDLSNTDLAKIFSDLAQYGKDQYGYTIITECLDLLTKEDYERYFWNVDVKKREELITLFSSPEELLNLDHERLSLLYLARDIQKSIDASQKDLTREFLLEKFPHYSERMREHVDKYFWIHNGFCKGIVLKEDYFFDDLQRILIDYDQKKLIDEIDKLHHKVDYLKNKRHEEEKKYKIEKNTIIFFDLVRFFAFLQDERKVLVQKQVHCMEVILQEVSRRSSAKRNDFDRYLVMDVVDLLKSGTKLSAQTLQKRSQFATFSYVEDEVLKTDYLVGEQAQEVIDFFGEEQRKHGCSNDFFEGFVASIGEEGKVFTGKVRIVFDPFDNDFQEGEILVTGMTRPEFMPLMKIAKAIITNEGGITTHAAIISRELKKPCIIGTRIATEVLKDGDLVEVDADKGIIKVLESTGHQNSK